jgi:hypothetical protein
MIERLSYAAVVVLCVAVAALAEAHRDALAAAHQDAAASITGLILGVLGFAFAFVQLARVKHAAVAASEAVANLTVRIRALEDVVIAEGVLAAANEIERMHVAATINADFASHVYLPERYRFLRTQLLEMRARLQARLTKEQRTILQATITRLATFERSVTRGLKSNEFPRLKLLDSSISDVMEQVVSILVDLKKDAVDVNVA